MSIIRVKKTSDYSIMSNSVFRSKDLSAKAKGLYAVLMTLPEDWKVYKTQLPDLFSDGKSAIFAAFEELQEAGYIEEHKEGGKGSGLIKISYTVHECRLSDAVKADSVNQHLLIPNKVITDKLISSAPQETGDTRESEGFKNALKVWQEVMEAPNPYAGRFRKALRPLWALYEAEDICQRLRLYLQSQRDRGEERYISPERFVTLFGTLKQNTRWKPDTSNVGFAGKTLSTDGTQATPF